MPNQGSTTLEVLLGQLAHNQNDETMYKVYADLASLTTANLKRVLGSLLDPVSFYSQYVLTREAFAEGLKKAYQRVQKDGVSRQLNALRGAIGLVCFMLELLSKAESQEHTSSTTLKWPQELLRDSAVRDQFYEVYKPTKRQDEDTDQKKNFEQAQKHWRELELDSLELYQIGTTSFILRCKLRDRKGEHLVLKCLLFPYTKVAFISDATRKYAIDYSGDNVPTTAKVHSSTDKWILMNFIDGRTLQELLDDRRNAEDKAKALPLLRTDLLASIGKMLLEALNKLSDANIQHEDLTPSNIIVSENKDGSIKEVILIDLGRNYLYTRRIGLAENREASFVAPEIRGDSNGTFTDTSDLYSFGMILIELADPQGVQGETIPDSLYQYAPALARFVEDLVDVNPDKRLLIFSQDRKDLLSAFVDELDVLPSDSEVKPWLPFRLWGRQIEIKPKVHFWVQQIRDLFFPSSQLALLRKLWRLNQSPKHAEIAKYSGRLYRWLIFCTIHWNLIFLFCITLGLFRDFGVGDFSAPMSFAQRYIFHCNNCVPVIDWLGAPGYRFNNVLAVLPARLTIFSVIAQTKYYQNILAGLTVKPIKSRLASFTEITLRGSAICSLIPILYCNLYQPSSWLIMLVLGYLTVGINNILCYQLAIRSLNEAKRKLSTVPRSDDPVLEAFETWGQNMIVYMVLLLAIWLGLQTGFLHDEWIYVIGTVGVSIFVWIISKCIKLGASLRGSLSRAFIAGERLEAIP